MEVAAALYRPRSESWDVGSKKYASTTEMMAALPADGQPVDAVFTSEARPEAPKPPPAPLTLNERLANGAVGTVVGAAGGAAAGAIGAGALVLGGEVLNLIAEILTIGMAHTTPVNLPIGTIALVCAAGGAIYGAYQGSRQPELEQPKSNQYSVSGQVQRFPTSGGADQVRFYPGGDVKKAVDLQQFAAAPEIPDAPAVDFKEPEARPRWKDALAGAGYGAGIIGSSLIPLAGLVVPAMMTANAFEHLDGLGPVKKENLAVLGGVVGAGLTIASWATINVAGWGAFGLLAGGAALTGAVAAPLLLPRARHNQALELARAEADARDPKYTQWWSAPREVPEPSNEVATPTP